jgi:predicted component of type VI protein secretion system
MTRLSCPSCRLRFSAAAASTFTTCPECGRELQAVASAEALVGYRRFDMVGPESALPMAVEVALPVPGPRPDET